MANYATIIQAKLFAHEADSLVEDESWGLLAESASRIFDRLTEVDNDFYAAVTGAVSNKTFIGDGTAYLKLPPYTTLAAVTPIAIVDNDNNALTLPVYLEQDGILVIRGQGVRYRDSLTQYNGWPLNMKITVSANWGFATIPADVTIATIQIALQMFRTTDAAQAQVSNTTEALPLAIPATAQEIADRYKAKYSNRAIFA